MKHLCTAAVALLAVTCSALALACSALAQEEERDVPWKAVQEIARRGSMVEHVDGIADEGDPIAAIADALAPPPDDSHKPFFTLVTKQSCPQCEKLRYDFEHSPHLQMWVNVQDYKKSWSHYQVIQSEDETQAWRFKDLKPRTFPTLIVQPPYNGSLGDPHTVIFLHEGYDGNAEALSAKIRAAFQQYAARVAPQPIAHLAKDEGGMRQQAPFQVVPQLPPPANQVIPPAVTVQQPAQPQVPAEPSMPTAGKVALTILSLATALLGVTNIVTLVFAIWQGYRNRRKAEGKPLIIPDDMFESLKSGLIEAVKQAK